jgi:hypothetical protein
VQTPVTLAARARTFGTTSKLLSGHEDETYEEFSSRYDYLHHPLASADLGRGGTRRRALRCWALPGSCVEVYLGPIGTDFTDCCHDYRFEKEFDGVQDVFELQVRSDTSNPESRLPMRYPISTTFASFISQMSMDTR